MLYQLATQKLSESLFGQTFLTTAKTRHTTLTLRTF